MEYEEIPISRDRCYDSSHELEKKNTAIVNVYFTYDNLPAS